MPQHYNLNLIREKLDAGGQHHQPHESIFSPDDSAAGGRSLGTDLVGAASTSGGFRKSVDPSTNNYTGNEQRFRYQEPVCIEADISQLTNVVQANCGQLMFLLNEMRPLQTKSVGLQKTVAEFDKLIQASRQREAKYVRQIEEQNEHLERLADEVHKLAALIPELRQGISNAQKDHQAETENFHKASEKWKRLEIKWQNELQNANLQIRQLEDQNLNLRNDYMSSKGGTQVPLSMDGMSKDKEIEKLRNEKEEYMQYSKYLLSIIDKQPESTSQP